MTTAQDIFSKVVSAFTGGGEGPVPEIVPVIMAGGTGSRLWPVSREASPKQFMKLRGEKSLLQETVERMVAAGVPAKGVFISTGTAFEAECRAHAEPLGVPSAHFIAEPERRNTLAALALICKYLKDVAGKADNAVVFWAPSDHIISPEKEFAAYVRRGAREAATGAIACFGIRPHAPETGFGYVKTSPDSSGPARDVVSFVEKPDRATAEKYLLEGGYFWNGGMFFFTLGGMLSRLASAAPGAGDLLALPYVQFVARYADWPAVAMEVAVVEKAPKVRCVPLDLFWSDVGSWDAVHADLPKDAQGNCLRGDVVASNTRDSLVWALSGRTVAVEGLSDVVVVDTKDAVLVARRGDGQSVRNLSAQLKKRKLA